MLAAETQPVELDDGVVRLGTELVNWYLVEEGGSVSVVDAGAPRYRPQLERGLAVLGRTPQAVKALLLTHGHADHVGVAEPLRRELSIAVYVHSDDERLARTRKQLDRREASLLPYLRHGAAWQLLAHLATSGSPKAIGEVTTFADGETVESLAGRASSTPRATRTGTVASGSPRSACSSSATFSARATPSPGSAGRSSCREPSTARARRCSTRSGGSSTSMPGCSSSAMASPGAKAVPKPSRGRAHEA